MSDIQDLVHQATLDTIERVRVEERERIIKLLEEQKKTYSSPKYSTTGGFVENFALDQAIELIKGENKTNPWTSRPLTDEDKEHYGLEGENK